MDDYAQIYAVNVYSNRVWSWKKNLPGNLKSRKMRKQIKTRAQELGLIPAVRVTKQDGMRFGTADFESAHLVRLRAQLPESMWKMDNWKQFVWLDAQIGGRPQGYTWHHSAVPGKMELVPFGIHNITAHNGGRTRGQWVDFTSWGGIIVCCI
ncbi:HNH endonuclease [uncultured Ruthenibacterium sp.]|uniref:HNH endonuclease signature motif containing protein n=1 Tax=uncultured Ruthenibacterium sp. TaxID=1905347 RepID=UPI00349E9B0F